MRGAVARRWPSVRARGVVLVAPLRGASARPCPLRRRAARPRALWCFGRCGGLAFRSAGGRAPRAVAPPSFAAPCSPSGCCAALRPRSPSGCAGLLLSCPLPGLGPPLWSLRSLRGVLAPLLPRRAAACGGVARRPGGGGAVPPPAPCSRVSPPSGPAPRRSRSASPGACRRCAASAWGGPAVPGPRCGGARRPGGRGGRAGARCGGPRLGALARPPRGVWGLRRCGGAFFAAAAARCCRAPPAAVWLRPRCSSALPSAAASFARCFARRSPRFGFARAARPPCLRLRLPSRAASRAARRGSASPALLVRLAFGCGFLRTLLSRFFRGCCGALLRPRCSSALPSAAASFARCFARRPPRFGFARAARLPCLRLRLPSHADGRATAARPFCAFDAFVVQREGELQGITKSTTYCVGYSLDIPYTGEFGKTRIILPNSIQKSNIPFGDIILRVKLAKIPVLPNRGDCLLPARFFPAYHAQRETSTKSYRYALA